MRKLSKLNAHQQSICLVYDQIVPPIFHWAQITFLLTIFIR